jgi:hypothetical protein
MRTGTGLRRAVSAVGCDAGNPNGRADPFVADNSDGPLVAPHP